MWVKSLGLEFRVGHGGKSNVAMLIKNETKIHKTYWAESEQATPEDYILL